MADTEENVNGLKRVFLLGPNQDWKQYFLRNPTLIFEDMKILEIVNENSDEPDEPLDLPFTFTYREVRHMVV